MTFQLMYNPRNTQYKHYYNYITHGQRKFQDNSAKHSKRLRAIIHNQSSWAEDLMVGLRKLPKFLYSTFFNH